MVQHTDHELIQIVLDCMMNKKSKIALADLPQLVDIARAVELSISNKTTPEIPQLTRK